MFKRDRFGPAALAAVVLAALAGGASASVFISNSAARFTQQSSAAGASPVYVAGFNQSIVYSPSSPGDFTDASVAVPDSTTRPLINNGLGDYYAQQSALDESAEPTLQPTGVYTFSVQGGTLGDGSVSITQPSISFPTILSLTNYNALLTADPAASFIGTLSPTVTDPAWSLARTFIQITDLTDSIGVLGTVIDYTDVGFVIPAGSLVAGHDYQLRLQTISYIFLQTSDASGSLADASALTSRISVTDIRFTAIPAPGSAALLALAGLGALRRRR
jgi:hypothetical protein